MPVNEETLLSFVGTNTSVLDEILASDATGLKNLLSTGAITGMKESEMLQMISKVTTTRHGAKAMLNTKLNTLSRIATNTMMKDAPSDTKYVYEGASDDRTRDECWDMLSYGELTEQEIISQFGAAVLVDGGGVNCRHKWEIAAALSKKVYEERQKKAKDVLAGKIDKTKKLNILSPKMAGKHIKSKDAINYMKTNFNISDVKNIDDVQILNQINKSFKKQKDLGININYNQIYAYKGSAGELARSSSRTLGIDVSKGIGFIRKTIKRHEANGWLYRGIDDIKSIIAHEAGHSLTQRHIGGSGKIWTSAGQKFSDIYKRYLKEIGDNKKAFLVKWKKMSKSEQNNYAKSFTNKKEKLRAYYGDTFVSEYSLTNVQEFIAESYSMAIYSNEPSHYATEIFNLIKNLNE